MEFIVINKDVIHILIINFSGTFFWNKIFDEMRDIQ